MLDKDPSDYPNFYDPDSAIHGLRVVKMDKEDVIRFMPKADMIEVISEYACDFPHLLNSLLDHDELGLYEHRDSLQDRFDRYYEGLDIVNNSWAFVEADNEY